MSPKPAQVQWTRKYTPMTRDDIQGQDSVIEQFNAYVLKHTSQSKKGLMLYGKSGIGKTSCIYAVAKDHDLEVLEINASDFRNKDKIESIVGGAVMQRSLFGRGKLILIDEIDGLSGNSDRGGIGALCKVIRKSVYPIVMTANDPYDKKFKDLRKSCELIQMNTPSYLSVATVLNKIVKKENIEADPLAIKSLARRAGGDIRAAINDLQSITADKKLTTNKVNSLSEREHSDSIHTSLMRIFKTTDPFIAKQALAQCDETTDTFALWLDENLPREYTKPEDLAKAYDAMSRADVFKGRIRRQQHYRFLVYINDLLSAGISLAKEEKYKGFNKYIKPRRILDLYIAKMKYAKRNAIALKIADNQHISKKAAITQISYLREIVKKEEWAEKIASELELSTDELAWLTR